MGKQIALFAILVCFAFNVKAQNPSSTENVNDTIVEYSEDGQIKAWYYSDTSGVYFMNVINKSIYHKMYGKYAPIQGTDDIVRLGIWTWFTKDGVLKDSVIYSKGAEIYRARFNNDGSLQYENQSGRLVVENRIIRKCDESYAIQFKRKGITVLNSMILPTYQAHGFLLAKNGVYDFVINGKKYFQSVILDITNNGFVISKDWNVDNGTPTTLDSIFFDIKSKIQIRLLSIHNGVGGLPTKTKVDDYDIEIIRTSNYCQFDDAEFTSTKGSTVGLYYFTAYGMKNLTMRKGKPYICEQTGDYVLRRK
ncbi:MAG: hypothetical protein ABFS32_16405 [Bacteroidota bacterium]